MPLAGIGLQVQNYTKKAVLHRALVTGVMSRLL